MRLPYDTYVFIPDIATSVRRYLFPNESKIVFQCGVMLVREKLCVGLKNTSVVLPILVRVKEPQLWLLPVCQ